MAIEKVYTLKLSTTQAQENVDELNESLKLQLNLIDDLEKEIRQYEKQLEKTSKTDLAAQKKIKDALKQKKEALKDEKIALKDLNKDRKKANEELKEATENAADYSGVLGMLDKQTGGVISSVKKFSGTIGKATRGMNLLKVAIIGTGIGALLIAITSVTAAFTSSEKGQKKFKKILASVGAVVSKVVELFADVGEVIIGLFSGDSEAIKSIKSFGKKLFDLVGLPIKNTIDTVKALGRALGALFSGDISGAFDELKQGVADIKENFSEANDVITGVTESVKGFAKETKEAATLAGQIADDRAKADKIERKLIVERAKANKERAALLEKSVQKNKFSIQERINLLKQAGEVEEKITNKELEAAQLRYDAKVKENSIGKTKSEDLKEEAELQANLINLQTEKLRKGKETSRAISSLEIQEKARLKEKADEFESKYTFLPGIGFVKKESLEKVIKNTEEVNKILDDITKQREDAKAETEVQKLELEKERKLKEIEDLILTEEQKADIISFYDDKITNAKNKNEEKQKKLKEIRTKQTLGDAKNTFNQIAQLAGEDSKVGKAFAIASATISGVEGVQNAYTTAQKSPITTVFPAYPIVSAGLAAAVAVKNIATIKKQDPSGKGASASPQRPSGIPPTPSIPPAFNVVGASGTNQLADAIGGQTQQPVQAYVVSSEVTTAQELDRNIIDDASIG